MSATGEVLRGAARILELRGPHPTAVMVAQADRTGVSIVSALSLVLSGQPDPTRIADEAVQQAYGQAYLALLQWVHDHHRDAFVTNWASGLGDHEIVRGLFRAAHYWESGARR